MMICSDENSLDSRLSSHLRWMFDSCGGSYAQFAARSNLGRDRLRRTLSGGRSATLSEATLILAALDENAEAHLMMTIAGQLSIARKWAGTPAIPFLSEFYRYLPEAIDTCLEEDATSLRPAWSRGAAQRLSKLLKDQVYRARKLDLWDACEG